MFKRLVLVMLFSVEIWTINLLLLKGTTEALPESDDAYALYHGVPFAEGLAENFYITGNKDIVAKVKHEIATSKQTGPEVESAKKSLEKYIEQSSQNELATSQLVSMLYYRPVGGQFQMTAAPNNPARYLTPGYIGNILRIIKESKKSNEVKIILEAKLLEYVLSLKLQKGSGSLFKPKEIKSLTAALVGSLQECDPTNPQAQFAPYTTEGILLGYCLNKSNSKQDLQDFFEGLTGKKITLPDGQYSKEDIKRIIAKGIELNNSNAFADWLTCAVYDKKYNSPLPKIVSNRLVSYDQVSFPDCVETTVRNLCNIATYDGSKLGINPQGVQQSSALANFYNQGLASVPAEVGNQSVHQAWVDVIENMPGVSYNRLKLKVQKDQISIPSDYEGFMLVDDSLISQNELEKLPAHEMMVGNQKVTLYKKQVGDAIYLLVAKNSNALCYELLPTASNMTICLNNLFDLKLYKPQDIFTDTFAKDNFKKICDKIGWQLQTPVTDNTKSIDINVCKGESCFRIGLSRKAHGAVTVTKNVVSKSVDAETLAKMSYDQHPEKISEVVSLVDDINIQKLYDTSGKNPENFLKLLRNIDVRNPDRSQVVIIEVIKLQFKNDLIDTYISNLIMSLPIYDIYYVNQIIKKTKGVFSKKIKDSLKSFFELLLVKEKISVNTIDLICILSMNIGKDKSYVLAFLQQAMRGGNQEMQKAVIQGLANGIGLGMDNFILDKQDVVSLLQEGMKTGNEETQKAVIRNLEYLKILDKQDVVSLLQEGMKTGNQEVQKSVFYNLEYLKILDKQDVISFLQEGMQTGNREVENYVIYNLPNLKRLDKQDVVSFLQEVMKTGNQEVQKSVFYNLQYLKILDKQGVVSFLQEVMKTGNQNAQRSVIRNLEYLKILDKQEILSLLKEAILTGHKEVRNSVFEILRSLKYKYRLSDEEVNSILDLKNKKPSLVQKFLGLFGKTQSLSMRHDPYAVKSYGTRQYMDQYVRPALDQENNLQQKHADLTSEKIEYRDDLEELEAKLKRLESGSKNGYQEKMPSNSIPTYSQVLEISNAERAELLRQELQEQAPGLQKFNTNQQDTLPEKAGTPQTTLMPVSMPAFNPRPTATKYIKPSSVAKTTVRGLIK